MQISLVGAGYWGSKLKAELETIPEVSEIEIIDIKQGKDLKDISFDNVILATPAWDHYSQTISLLQKDKNLYVEKPLALTCTDCCVIKSFLRGQTLMVGHIFLYNDRVRKIKELLPSIGEIKHIEMNRLNWGRFQTKISTVHSLAPHDVSIIDYWLGTHEFKNVKHSGYNFSKQAQNDRDEFEFTCNNIPVKFNMSWYYPEKVRTTAIIGTKGMVWWDEQTKTVKLTTNIWNEDRMNYEPRIEDFKIISNPLRNELVEFVNCVNENRKPISDINNAIRVAKNLDLLSKSLSHQ